MKGILIYAFNNDRIDYFQQAIWCADRATQHLGVPCTIVTDKNSRSNQITQHDVILVEAIAGGKRVYNPGLDHKSDTWYNGNRYQSFDLSPYDQTIVLDSDYVVCSDRLNLLFDSSWPVLAMKNVYDVTNRDGFDAYRWISNHRRLHHYWATVLYHDKSETARHFFDIMAMIKNNYQHYANIYHFQSHPFRNDFAASIALNTIYGHIPENVPVIPWNMANVFSDVDIKVIEPDTFELTYLVGTNKAAKKILLRDQDFHFMNKVSLARLYEH